MITKTPLTTTDTHTLKRKRGLLTVRDVWYYADTVYTDADVVYYMQMEKPQGDEWYDQYTILIDLEKSKDAIFGAFNETCKNEIRSVTAKTGYTFSILHRELNETTLNEFIKVYNQFAAVKNIPPTENYRLFDYLHNGLLAITKINDANNKTVVWHVYRVNSDKVFLIHSISDIYKQNNARVKNELGSANRFCHWSDMLYFKELGIKQYDWGGWYNGKEDTELLGVNKFKEKFGGTITPNYNGIAYITLKGKLFWFLKKLKSKV